MNLSAYRSETLGPRIVKVQTFSHSFLAQTEIGKAVDAWWVVATRAANTLQPAPADAERKRAAQDAIAYIEANVAGKVVLAADEARGAVKANETLVQQFLASLSPVDTARIGATVAALDGAGEDIATEFLRALDDGDKEAALVAASIPRFAHSMRGVVGRGRDALASIVVGADKLKVAQQLDVAAKVVELQLQDVRACLKRMVESGRPVREPTAADLLIFGGRTADLFARGRELGVLQPPAGGDRQNIKATLPAPAPGGQAQMPVGR